MLESQNVNLRVVEKEDLQLLAGWVNNLEFYGEYFSPLQRSARYQFRCKLVKRNSE